MLIYAQREAEDLSLPSVADLLRQAIARMDMARSAAPFDAPHSGTAHSGTAQSSKDGMIRTDLSADVDVHQHFTSSRLQ
ncbi:MULTISPECIES: hypothetical protein [unclassified Aureimonas]|uniref:hypothetical protein n=1 Tax=unclassified Aureimonas TaxID=2615206 RepID=UPI00070917F1|nr:MULTISPECIES: hypothetical protein [unclassified Aureimonas]KQT69081.1 hypothetical protein ASG54_05390 [Aureimonas sp. Leaf460]KQT69319.1 hypothetical protein ASG62_17995 [Aureimonas sp. Leaf427]